MSTLFLPLPQHFGSFIFHLFHPIFNVGIKKIGEFLPQAKPVESFLAF